MALSQPSPRSSLLLIVLLSVGLPLAARSQNRPLAPPPVWTATQVAPAFKSEVSVFSTAGDASRSRPRAGQRYLEVRALFSANVGNPAVPKDSAYVLLSGEPITRVSAAAIAIAGADGACMYSTLELLSGGVSETVAVTNASGIGYRLYREQERGPILIALAMNPNPTCLLFVIRGDREPQSVQFGDARIALGAATIAAASPLPVEALVRLEAGRHHTCGLTSGGRVLCWGENEKGQLGDRSGLPSPTPVEVQGGFTFTQLTTGDGDRTCGLTRAGLVLCWGATVTRRARRDELAAAGYADSVRRDVSDNLLVPTMVSMVPRAARVVTGPSHSCALAGDGAIFCWGSNVHGQLGDGTYESRASSKRVGTMSFTAVVTGGLHTCALDAGGRAYCWGSNRSGQLGDGSVVDRLTPTPVSAGVAFTQLAAGHWHTCGVTIVGAMFCWGDNSNGQLGSGELGTKLLLPVAVATNVRFGQVSAGGSHTCAIGEDAVAYCWGMNGMGQLGHKPTKDEQRFPNGGRAVATPVPGYAFAWLSAGSAHTCGISTDGRPVCWGSNSEWQLGDRTLREESSPSPVRVRHVLSQDPSRPATLSVGKGVNGLKECTLTSVQRRGEDGIVALSGEEMRSYTLPEGDYIVSALVGRNDKGGLVSARFLFSMAADHVYRVTGGSVLVNPSCVGVCKYRIVAWVRDMTDREDVPVRRLP